MRKLLFALFALAFALPAQAQNYTATQGTGTTFGTKLVSGVNYPQWVVCDPTTPANCAAVSAGGALSTAVASGVPDLTQAFSITSSTTSSSTFAIAGTQSVQFNLTGTFVATVVGQISNDGTNWTSMPLLNMNTALWTAAASGVTVPGNYAIGGSQGARYARVSVTYTSGTVAGAVTATSQGSSATLGDYANWLAYTSPSSGIAGNNCTTQTAVAAGATSKIQTDPNGNILIACSQLLNTWTKAQTSSLASSLVAKSSAGTLGGYQITADSTLAAATWWAVVFDATAFPSNGAITPTECVQVPSGTTYYSLAEPVPGATMATGIVVGVSTTGCFTLTSSAHAFISAKYN